MLGLSKLRRSAEGFHFSPRCSFYPVVPAASTAASNVCRGREAATREPKCERTQLLLSDHRRCRCFNCGTCELRRLFLSEHRRLRRCNDGYREKCALGWSGNDGKREQRARADLSAAVHVSSLGSTMTAVSGPAVMPQSARRWYGLPTHSPVLSRTPGSLTVTRAAASG